MEFAIQSSFKMGDYLAQTIKEKINSGDVDVVMPIPDSSRPAAMQVARQLGIEYREGLKTDMLGEHL